MSLQNTQRDRCPTLAGIAFSCSVFDSDRGRIVDMRTSPAHTPHLPLGRHGYSSLTRSLILPSPDFMSAPERWPINNIWRLWLAQPRLVRYHITLETFPPVCVFVQYAFTYVSRRYKQCEGKNERGGGRERESMSVRGMLVVLGGFCGFSFWSHHRNTKGWQTWLIRHPCKGMCVSVSRLYIHVYNWLYCLMTLLQSLWLNQSQ